jgi:FkbM family methyltransferase
MMASRCPTESPTGPILEQMPFGPVSRLTRWITRRIPSLPRRVVIRLHRQLIGSRRVVLQLDGFSLALSVHEHCGGRLFYTGKYEEENTRVFHDLLALECPDVFVDVGANIGYYSMIAWSHQVRQIVCFEPSPIPLEYLAQTVAINDPEGARIRIERVALAEQDGRMEFWLNPTKHNLGLGSLTGPRPEAGPARVQVPVRRGDGVLELGPGARALVKIDVEGAELLVLRGMSGIFTRCHPTLILEIHPSYLRDLGHTPADIVRLLRDAAYDVTLHLEGTRVEVGDGSEITAISWLVARASSRPQEDGRTR